MGLGCGTLFSFMQTPRYLAVAQVEIMPPTAKILADLNVVDQSSDDRAFETARARLMSRDVAQRVVSTLQLDQNASVLFPRAGFSVTNLFTRVFGSKPSNKVDSLGAEERNKRAVDAVMGGLAIGLVHNTSILSVGYSTAEPRLAMEIANQAVKSYMDQQVDQTISTSDLARQFIQQQVKDAKDKLAESEQALVDYAKKAGITVSESDGSLISSNIEAINTSLATAMQDRLGKERLVQQIDAGNGRYLPSVVQNDGIQKLQTDIAGLEAQYQQKLNTFKADYPDMVTLAAQIRELKRQLEQAVGAAASAVRLDYQASVDRETDLRAKLGDLEAQQVAFQDKNIQYTILNREVESNRSQYKALVDKLNALGASDLTQPTASVVDFAVLPDVPFSPRLSVNVLIALGLSLAGSAAVIYLKELVNNKFSVPDQVEAELLVPVLGIVPKLEKGKLEEALKNPKSGLSEAFRSLRTSLQYSSADGAPKVLAVTSAEPGETKSTTVYKLAEEFGAIGVTVLVVDTDMRRPALHRIFRTDNERGLSDLLTRKLTADETREIFRNTEIPNVTFISSGPLAPSPANLLSSDKMAAVLLACAKKFDMVILDGPPVLGLSDAPIMARLADATLMVVAANQVSRKSAVTSMRRLRSTGANVIGSLFSMFSADRFEYSYAYRYMGDRYYAYAETPALADGSALAVDRPRLGRAARAWAGLYDRCVGYYRQWRQPTD